MVKVRGFQVAPAEIEAVLHGHPAVRDCAVFGVPDGINGEAVIAAVATDKPISADELAALLADRRRPTSARATSSSSPRSRLPSGKALRRVLKERYGCPSDH